MTDDVQDPREAGPPRVTGPTREYEGNDLRVIWDSSRCIHVANCLRALPEVFDVQARPWVDIEGADPDQIAAAVRTCPTGALRYEGSREGEFVEPSEEPTALEVRPNGPLYVRGRVRILGPGGVVISEENRVALCRCGASENKPFCDNSHRLIQFRG